MTPDTDLNVAYLVYEAPSQMAGAHLNERSIFEETVLCPKSACTKLKGWHNSITPTLSEFFHGRIYKAFCLH